MTEETNQSQGAEVTTDSSVTQSALDSATSNDWRTSLPEDLQNDSSLADFKDVGALAKSYVHAQQMIGNSIRIPTAEAGEETKAAFYEKLQSVPGVVRLPGESPEERAAFYQKLGCPENPDNYDISFPEEYQPDESRLNMFKETAHKLGLNNDQAKSLIEMEIARESAEAEAFQKAAEAGVEQIKQLWGNDFDNQKQAANQVLDQYSEKFGDAVTDLINGPAGNNPVLMAMLADLGKSMRESQVAVPGAQAPQNFTPADARQRIDEIKAEARADRNHPLMNESHPEHRKMLQIMEELYKDAHPTISNS